MQLLKTASKPLKIFTVIVAIIAIVAPVYFAIDQSWRYGQREQLQKVLAYARDVLARTEATSDQMRYGLKLINDAKLADPCSNQSIEIMRNIDLRSSYIQAMGYMEHNSLLCSSLGGEGKVLDLGPVDWVSGIGSSIRINVQIPFAKDTSFTVIERNSYAFILNKTLLIDATTSEKDVSLASFSQDNLRLFASRGKFNPEWLKYLGDEPEIAFVKDGYVVGIARSQKYRSAGLAALPVSYIDKQTQHLSIIMVPIALIAGLILVASIYHLVTIQTSLPVIIKAALRDHEFFMLYQPVINLKTGECVGAEALMRLKRQNGDIISPDIFIQAAEDSGLIGRLTERAIKLVSQDAKDLFIKHPEFHIAINLSASDLHSTATLQHLQELKQATGANTSNLIVEATERGFMQADLAKSMLIQIREQGISVAIDDFGTGYSSLSYLESFEMDYLKIDKSFVDKIGTDAPTSYVVNHIIEMAKELKIQMIAEGVETESQARFLREHGVQYAQGWLFGKPMPLHEVVRMFKKK